MGLFDDVISPVQTKPAPTGLFDDILQPKVSPQPSVQQSGLFDDILKPKSDNRGFFKSWGTGYKQSFTQVPGIVTGSGEFAGKYLGIKPMEEAFHKENELANKRYTEDPDTAIAERAGHWDTMVDQVTNKKNPGAILDFLGQNFGYGAGQVTMAVPLAIASALGGAEVATAAAATGVGAKVLANKFIADAITKQSLKIAFSSVGKKLGAEAIREQAIKNVAGKIAGVLAMGAYGQVQEGGQIYPDLERNKGRENITRGDLNRALAATGVAGGLEMVENVLTFGVLSKAIPLPGLKNIALKGIKGKVAKGALGFLEAGGAGAVVEGSQALAEDIGSQTPPSWENIRNSAAMGFFSEGQFGGVGGLLTKSTKLTKEQKLAELKAISEQKPSKEWQALREQLGTATVGQTSNVLQEVTTETSGPATTTVNNFKPVNNAQTQAAIPIIQQALNISDIKGNAKDLHPDTLSYLVQKIQGIDNQGTAVEEIGKWFDVNEQVKRFDVVQTAQAPRVAGEVESGPKVLFINPMAQGRQEDASTIARRFHSMNMRLEGMGKKPISLKDVLHVSRNVLRGAGQPMGEAEKGRLAILEEYAKIETPKTPNEVISPEHAQAALEGSIQAEQIVGEFKNTKFNTIYKALSSLPKAFLDRIDIISKKDLPVGKVVQVSRDGKQLKEQVTSDIEAYYDPETDRIAIVGENVTPENARSKALHEVTHRGFHVLLDSLNPEAKAQFQEILGRAREQLYRAAPVLLKDSGYANVDAMAKDYGFTSDEQILMELAARWAERYGDLANISWFKRLKKDLALWVQQWLKVKWTEDDVDNFIKGVVNVGVRREFEAKQKEFDFSKKYGQDKREPWQSSAPMDVTPLQGSVVTPEIAQMIEAATGTPYPPEVAPQQKNIFAKRDVRMTPGVQGTPKLQEEWVEGKGLVPVKPEEEKQEFEQIAQEDDKPIPLEEIEDEVEVQYQSKLKTLRDIIREMRVKEPTIAEVAKRAGLEEGEVRGILLDIKSLVTSVPKEEFLVEKATKEREPTNEEALIASIEGRTELSYEEQQILNDAGSHQAINLKAVSERIRDYIALMKFDYLSEQEEKDVEEIEKINPLKSQHTPRYAQPPALGVSSKKEALSKEKEDTSKYEQRVRKIERALNNKQKVSAIDRAFYKRYLYSSGQKTSNVTPMPSMEKAYQMMISGELEGKTDQRSQDILATARSYEKYKQDPKMMFASERIKKAELTSQRENLQKINQILDFMYRYRDYMKKKLIGELQIFAHNNQDVRKQVNSVIAIIREEKNIELGLQYAAHQLSKFSKDIKGTGGNLGVILNSEEPRTPPSSFVTQVKDPKEFSKKQTKPTAVEKEVPRTDSPLGVVLQNMLRNPLIYDTAVWWMGKKKVDTAMETKYEWKVADDIKEYLVSGKKMEDSFRTSAEHMFKTTWTAFVSNRKKYLAKKLGRAPTMEELQEELDWAAKLMAHASPQVMTGKWTTNGYVADDSIISYTEQGDGFHRIGKKDAKENTDNYVKYVMKFVNRYGIDLAKYGIVGEGQIHNPDGTSNDPNTLRNKRTPIFWQMLADEAVAEDTELQDILRYVKGNIQNTFLETMIKAGVYTHTNLYQKIKEGYEPRTFKYDPTSAQGKERVNFFKGKQGGPSTVDQPKAEFDTYDAFAGAGYEEGWTAVDNFWDNNFEYAVKSPMSANQANIIRKLGSSSRYAFAPANFKDKEFRDAVNDDIRTQLKELKVCEYTDSPVILEITKLFQKALKDQALEPAAILNQLGYVMARESSGLVKYNKGIYSRPYLYSSVNNMVNTLWFDRPDFQSMAKAFQFLNMARNIKTGNPFDNLPAMLVFSLLNSGSKWTFLPRAAYTFGVKVPAVTFKAAFFKEGTGQKMLRGETTETQTEGYELLEDMIKAGGMGMSYESMMRQVLDYNQSATFAERSSGGERMSNWWMSWFGINSAMMEQIVKPEMYNATKLVYEKNLASGAFPNKEAAMGAAVAYIDSTANMIHSSLMSDEGKWLRILTMSRGYAIGPLRNLSILARKVPLLGKSLKKAGYYDYKTGMFSKNLNAITAADLVDRDLRILSAQMMLDTSVLFFYALLTKGITQFILSFLDDDDEDEFGEIGREKGFAAKKRWIFNNDSTNWNKVRVGRINQYWQPQYIDTQLFRPIRDFIDITSSIIDPLAQTVTRDYSINTGRGINAWALGKIGLFNTFTEIAANQDWRGNPITDPNLPEGDPWKNYGIIFNKLFSDLAVPIGLEVDGGVPIVDKDGNGDPAINSFMRIFNLAGGVNYSGASFEPGVATSKEFRIMKAAVASKKFDKAAQRAPFRNLTMEELEQRSDLPQVRGFLRREGNKRRYPVSYFMRNNRTDIKELYNDKKIDWGKKP